MSFSVFRVFLAEDVLRVRRDHLCRSSCARFLAGHVHDVHALERSVPCFGNGGIVNDGLGLNIDVWAMDLVSLGSLFLA